MQNDLDKEEVSPRQVRMPASGQETNPAAGRPYGEAADYTDLNRAMTDDPWRSFSSENDDNLASWIVQSKVAKSKIHAHFAQGLGGTDS